MDCGARAFRVNEFTRGKMQDAPIYVTDSEGATLGRLRTSALSLVSEAEELARKENLSKLSAIPRTLRQRIEDAGWPVSDQAISDATRALGRVRRGEAVERIEVPVSSDDGHAVSSDLPVQSGRQHKKRSSKSIPENNRNPMATKRKAKQNGKPGSGLLTFFETERTYPDEASRALYERLVGLDEHKERLLMEFEMLLYPQKLEAWSREHHGQVLQLCESYQGRVPLILLEGDVGTGKTALAETVGDALARSTGSEGRVHLLKVNTQVRGTGQVGEMSELIVEAFAQAKERAESRPEEPVLLVIDEADALASSRDTQQMHHEDRAGLNTLLQRLDNLRLSKAPLAAIFITNRPDALDPAIRRRAALDLRFERPGDEERAQILRKAVPELELKGSELETLVRLTGAEEDKNEGLMFTASDLTDRLLPGALRAAYAERRPMQARDLLRQAERLRPTPEFGGSS